jgi:acetylornithine/succinyldiaminopimelate/putrescine aminotransferase
VIAVEGSFHGRTAAAGAVTWGAQQKWYGFPNKPFDVKFIKPTDIDKLGSLVSDATAAVIVEPIQGVAGAVDMPKEFLEALRVRCTENGSLLIFDEVQCGVGRTGHPFAANLYGVTPDIITTAKALGAGFPVSAILVGNHIVPYLKVDSLGTTFGGGPMACAVVEAVIDIIEDENLLENVRERSQQIRDTCIVGPVVGTQGAGLLLGLRCSRPAKEVQAELLERDILTGTSGDPHVLRILAPFVLGSEHVELLREALVQLAR